MTVRIKTEKELRAFAKENGFSENSVGHLIAPPHSYMCSLHYEVFENGGVLITDFRDEMAYRHHRLPKWAVKKVVTDAEKRDQIVLSQTTLEDL